LEFGSVHRADDDRVDRPPLTVRDDEVVGDLRAILLIRAAERVGGVVVLVVSYSRSPAASRAS
jgi:hypothetical protein